MQFRNFAENLLGSKVKIKLLKHLLSEGAITSEREIARLIGVSPGAVNRTLKEFYELNLINPMRLGNVTAWRLNEKSYAYSYIAGFFNKVKNAEEPIDDLVYQIKSLSCLVAIKRAIIFGSVADGKELPGSDIDLFILMESEAGKKSVISKIDDLSNICIQRYGNKLSIHIFTSRDMDLAKNKKFLGNVMRGFRVIDR